MERRTGPTPLPKLVTSLSTMITTADSSESRRTLPLVSVEPVLVLLRTRSALSVGSAVWTMFMSEQRDGTIPRRRFHVRITLDDSVSHYYNEDSLLLVSGTLCRLGDSNQGRGRGRTGKERGDGSYVKTKHCKKNVHSKTN